VTEKIETTGILPPEVTDQQVTAIHFDANHVVSSIDYLTQANAKNVQIVSKTTPTEGHEFTVMEQLFGNFGRFATPARSINPRDTGH
jgi:outer membrane protein assembly factor BamE (lipoprotein component of BamABCDE complex)